MVLVNLPRLWFRPTTLMMVKQHQQKALYLQYCSCRTDFRRRAAIILHQEQMEICCEVRQIDLQLMITLQLNLFKLS
jgi:hypothetical protein